MYPIADGWSARMDAEVTRGHMGAKLAFTRLSFPPYMSDAAFEYVLEAVHLVADEGWKLLPQYRFDAASGLFCHRAAAEPAARLGFGAAPPATAPESVLPGQLAAARAVVARAAADAPAGPLADPPVSDEFERVRWFALPGEALAELRAADYRIGARRRSSTTVQRPGRTRALARAVMPWAARARSR
jgi:hypothetical protein